MARAKRYCQRYGIEQRVIKTDEMIFCDHLRHLNEVIDPVRYICHLTALETDWSHLPMLLPAPVEELQEYLRRFGSLPTNTLWLFAKRGMTHRDFRYGFNKRQLGRWGKSAHGCLSYRFSDPELVGAVICEWWTWRSRCWPTWGWRRPRCSFIPSPIGPPPWPGAGASSAAGPGLRSAAGYPHRPQSTAFDLVTLDMAAEEERQSWWSRQPRAGT